LKRKAEDFQEYVTKKRINKPAVRKAGQSKGKITLSRGKINQVSAFNSNKGVKAQKNKQVKKNKRAPKVSKAFSKKVKDVLSKDIVTGVYTNTVYGSVTQDTSDWQTVRDLGTTLGGMMMFNPIAVFSAASVLWKSALPRREMDWNVGAPSQYFDPTTVVINVKNSYSTLSFKNNSIRSFTLDIYNCMPKSNRAATIDSPPARVWVNCLNDDYIAGLAKVGANGGATTRIPDIGFLYATPGQTSGFSREFTYTHRTIKLDPGQDFTHNVQGPKNTKYDYAKFQDPISNGFFDVQKGKSVFVMAVVRADLVNSSTGHHGHLQADAPAGQSITIERRDHYILGMPEQTGQLSTTDTALVQRHRAWSMNNWNDETAEGNVVRVDENNPISTQSVA